MQENLQNGKELNKSRENGSSRKPCRSTNLNKIKSHIRKLKEIKEHYIIWWIGRMPSQQDFDIIQNALTDLDAQVVSFKKFTIKYRIFLGGTISYHIIIYRKYWGFAVNIHQDIGIHSEAVFNKHTLKLLSKTYLHIKDADCGECFLLPRQRKAFEKFLKFNKNKWNLF